MAAYILVDIHIKNPETYEQYKKMVVSMVESHGGKYLARGGRTLKLEGEGKPGRVVILEFPTFEQAKAWHESAEYAPAKALRNACAKTEMILVQGV